MRFSKVLTVFGVHAEGEVGRVITGGVAGIPGATIAQKMEHLEATGNSLLKFALFEPRGNAQMSCNLLLPPCHPDADMGFIVMQPDGWHAMSGSNAMCVATVLLETGMVTMREPETVVVLDTPAGLVRATASCRDGKVERVSLEMPPSFLEQSDVSVTLDDGSVISLDIAYGGVYFALVSIEDLDVSIRPEDAVRLIDSARRIKAAVNRQVAVSHPTIPGLNRVEYVMFISPFDSENRTMRSGTVIYPGRMDRSPCGTGTAARLAALHAKGALDVGVEVSQYSIIDSRFDAKIIRTCDVGGRPAVVPRISGRAWIYSISQLGVDPTDPYQEGYILPDTWGPEAFDAVKAGE